MNSVEFYQLVRDECYQKSLERLSFTDLLAEHQEVPILAYCEANDLKPSELSFQEQKSIYDRVVDTACYEAEMFANLADELDKQAYIKTLCQIGLENIPTTRATNSIIVPKLN